MILFANCIFCLPEYRRCVYVSVEAPKPVDNKIHMKDFGHTLEQWNVSIQTEKTNRIVRVSTVIGIFPPTETAGELDADLLTPMEEKEETEKGIMVDEQGDEGEGRPQSMDAQVPTKEKEGNCVEACAALEEKATEKGMEEEEEMQKETELEAEVKVELKMEVEAPGSQMSFIHGSDLFGYVGIEAVLDQMRRKTMKAGFEFNIMVVGECRIQSTRVCLHRRSVCEWSVRHTIHTHSTDAISVTSK